MLQPVQKNENLLQQEARGRRTCPSVPFTWINVATAAIALWWAQVRVSTSGLAPMLTSLLLLLCVLVTMTSGLPLLAAASAAALAALAAALLLARAAFSA